MHRYQFRAQCRKGIDPHRLFQEALPCLKSRMEACGARQLSLFRFGAQLFLYYESLSPGADPHRLFVHCEDALEPWPGEDRPRRWVPMTDIFHYQRPVSEDHWLRKNPAARPYGRIARLKPEYAASYIFYHYQYQEERPGDGDKYGMIALHENLMFFYSEAPATLEPAPYAGALPTSNTPSDWMGTMEPHFIPWDGEEAQSRFWLALPLLIRA